MVRREKSVAQQIKPKRLPGPEDKLNGDSIQRITETQANDDATHRSLLQIYTEELKIHETSVEELNLIADRSAVELDENGNNISLHSSSMAISQADPRVINLKLGIVDDELTFENSGTAQVQKSFAEKTPGILVCEDTPSSHLIDLDPAMVFQSDDPSPGSYKPQITITSQDFDEHLINSQSKPMQNAPMFNPSNKKSFASNRESFINSRQHKSSLLNNDAF